MDNLNKENFFNSMEVLYPNAMLKFHAWIDEFKKSVNWDELFNAGRLNPGRNSETLVTVAPKFHDLPYEFQFGILMRFCLETFEGDDAPAAIGPGEMIVLFDSCLEAIEKEKLY